MELPPHHAPAGAVAAFNRTLHAFLLMRCKKGSRKHAEDGWERDAGGTQACRWPALRQAQRRVPRRATVCALYCGVHTFRKAVFVGQCSRVSHNINPEGEESPPTYAGARRIGDARVSLKKLVSK